MSSSDQDKEPETDWQRKARLAKVFGDVLPESTTDDRDPETAAKPRSSDQWLKDQVPPHHGS